MADKRAYLCGVGVFLAAVIAETITASAHGIAWEEAHGNPILTEYVSVNDFTKEEMELMARVVQAEYGNGDGTDKRLIVSVILNRLESDLPDFRSMDTVEKVVCAPNQFAMADWYSLEALDAVYREVEERTDDRVLWFCAGNYGAWGMPLFSRNNHFFSGWVEPIKGGFEG